jgi:mRNA interferase HigB
MEYYGNMHVIAKPALISFWTTHPDAERPLQVWYHTMENETINDFNELRDTFARADYVNGLTVFDIGGNKYRLIASIHYNRRKAYIRNILTHAEYDRGVWKRKI